MTAGRDLVRQVRSWGVWQYSPLQVLHVISGQALLLVLITTAVLVPGTPDMNEWVFAGLCGLGLWILLRIENYYGARRWENESTTFALDDCWYLAVLILAPLEGVLVLLLVSLVDEVYRIITIRSGRDDAGALGATTRKYRDPHKIFYNLGGHAAASLVAFATFHTLEPRIGYAASAVIMTVVWIATVNLISSSIVAHMSHTPYFEGFFHYMTSHAEVIASVALLGTAFPLIWESEAPLLVVTLLPVLGFSYRAILLASAMSSNMVDETTGVMVKRYWKLAALSHLDRAALGVQSVSMLVVDLDHFKKVNDTYGHIIGDVVLREVATRLSASVRPGDVVGRFGGEEFVILLPATEAEEARKVAERCRQSIAMAPLATHLGQEISGSASIGVVSSRGRTGTLDEVLALADDALYKSKESGRNKVVVADPAPEITDEETGRATKTQTTVAA